VTSSALICARNQDQGQQTKASCLTFIPLGPHAVYDLVQRWENDLLSVQGLGTTDGSHGTSGFNLATLPFSWKYLSTLPGRVRCGNWHCS